MPPGGDIPWGSPSGRAVGPARSSVSVSHWRSSWRACGGSTSAPLDNVGAPVVGTGSGGEQTAPTAAPAAAPAQPGDINGNPSSALQDNLKIVYTGSLQLVVDDLQQALAKGRAAVAAAGGYIGASEEHNDGDKSVATITYRIPAARWEDTLAALRGLGSKVVAEQTQATEVGSQIVDLEARIRNLRASESALVEIAKGTGKVSDLLEVEAQLTDVRGQIEQLDAQRTQLNDQVAYGTLVTTYGTEIKAVQETAQGWDPATGRGQRRRHADRGGPGDRQRCDLVRHRGAAAGAGAPRPRPHRPLRLPALRPEAGAEGGAP